MNCKCRNVEIGSYDNQVELERPSHMKIKSGKKICIDTCLKKEIEYLWDLKITTTGCCCGHNIERAYVGVANKDIFKMKKLGYEVHINKLRSDSDDSFYPKSLNAN